MYKVLNWVHHHICWRFSKMHLKDDIWPLFPKLFEGIVVHCVKKVPIWSFVWSIFCCIQTEYGMQKLQSKSTYSVLIRENKDHKYSMFRHFYILAVLQHYSSNLYICWLSILAIWASTRYPIYHIIACILGLNARWYMSYYICFILCNNVFAFSMDGT